MLVYQAGYHITNHYFLPMIIHLVGGLNPSEKY